MGNPLKAYFRQPAISVELLSKGDFWDDNSLDVGGSNEVDILPMTAADEIILKTPDLLMNGSAIVRLLESCVPAIKDGRKCPIIDFEALLIAIKIASNGSLLEVSIHCPKCNEENNYDINLHSVLESISLGNWKQPLLLNGLEIYFRPLTFDELNVYNTMVFKSRRLAKQIELLDNNEEKENLSNGIIKEMNSNNVQMVVQSIKGIMANGELILNKDYIAEYLMSCDKKTYNQIKERFESLRETTVPKNISVQCPSCNYEFSIPFTLDYASFFV